MSVGTLTRELPTPAPVAGSDRVRSLLRRPEMQALVGLLVLAAVLRFYRIGHQTFWFDEANTANDLRFSLGKMLGLLPQNETTPPLFYVLAWFWARIFGYGEVGMRSLTCLIGVGTVVVTYAVGTRLISRRAGLVAAALAACNPFLVWYSQEFRPYQLMVLLGALSLLCFDHVRHGLTTRNVVTWAAVGAAAIADHYYAFLIVVPEAVWLLWLYRRDRRMLAAFAFVGAVGCALLPLAISQNNTGNASWIAPIPLMPRLRQLFPNFVMGFQPPLHAVLEPIAAAMVFVGLALLVLRADTAERRGALLAGGFAIGGLVLNLLVIAGGIDDLITRNILALWVPAALLVAGGLGARRAGRVGIAATVVICALGIAAVIQVAVNRDRERPDWRAVAHVLGAHPAAGDAARAIFVQHYKYLLPLSASMPHMTSWPLHGARVRELDIVTFSSPYVTLCWYGAACNLGTSRVQASYPVPGFHEIWRRRVYQFTVVRLVAPRPVRLTARMMARVLTTTSYRKDSLIIQRAR